MRSQTVHLRLIRISATVCKRCSSSEAWPAKACDKWQLQQFSIIFYLSLEICTQREGSLFSCFLIKMATSGYTAWFVFFKPLAFGFQFVWIQPIFFSCQILGFLRHGPGTQQDVLQTWSANCLNQWLQYVEQKLGNQVNLKLNASSNIRVKIHESFFQSYHSTTCG